LPGTLHDLGAQHPAIVVDGDDHGQFAVELAPARLGEIGRAVVFDLASQFVVVDGVHRFPCGRADVALAGAGVLFVDAAFDLGEHLHQRLPLRFAFLRLRAEFVARVWQGQAGQLLAQLGQQAVLLLLHRFDAALVLVQCLAQPCLRCRGQW